MKLSATSSAGLPFNPPSVGKRAEEGGEQERPIWSRPFSAQPSRVSGSRPFPGESPAPPALTRGRDPRGGAGGSQRPRPLRTQAPPPLLWPGLPGSNRLSIQLPVARSPERARPTPPGRSPGLDCTTFPTPKGRPWRQVGPAELGGGGGEQPCNRSPGEKGVLRPTSHQYVSRGSSRTPASRAAHPSSGWCPWVSRALATLGTIIKTRRGRGYHCVLGDGIGP